MRLQNIGKLFGIVTIVLVIAGCGGGSSSGSSTPVAPPAEPAPPAYTPGGPDDAMVEKDYIVIYYNYSAEVCRDPATREAFEKQAKGYLVNYLLQVESNTVDCDTYGRDVLSYCVSDDLSLVPPYEKYNTSCVVGADWGPEVQTLDIEEKVSILEDVAMEALE